MNDEHDDALTRRATTGDADPRSAAPANQTAPRILTIVRSLWRRGGDRFNEQDGETVLLHPNGKMCCLGFDALACGFTRSQILDISSPAGLGEVLYDGEIPQWYRASRMDDDAGNHFYVRSAMAHNDNNDCTEEERERLIRADLIALGWEDVVFVDSPASAPQDPA